MRILFATHRFGRELVAGAELHLWNLARQMAVKGHDVSVVTTQQDQIAPFLRFGLRWSGKIKPHYEKIDIDGAEHPIQIHRFPVKDHCKCLAAWKQKKLQHRWEEEEMAMEPMEPLPVPYEPSYPLLLTGWHLPEMTGGKVMRWTMPRAAVQLPNIYNGSLHLTGFAPKRQTISILHNGRKRVIFKGSGNFQISIRLDDCSYKTIAVFEVDPVTRPLRDSRTLGVYLTQMSFTNQGRIELAPLHVDHRTIRAVDHESFIQTYIERAKERPEKYESMFDALRGPRCPGMQQFLEDHCQDYDWVIAGILPFSILPMVAEVRKEKRFRFAALPLFHVDDDFYYWRHYIKALRRADTCLANSWYSGEVFFPAIEAKSILAGAGVNDAMFLNPNIKGDRFRKKFKLSEDERIILSVGRKNGPKRYRTLVRAVDNIQYRTPCKLILVGPDEDGLPIASANCSYLGVLSQEDLLDAYEACDIFALMSESESFGMVFVEAWMRKKPVVGNLNCAPVSYLIRHEVNGLLARDREELEDRLVELLKDPEKCRQFGESGYKQAVENHTWPVIANRVLSYFEAHLD
ncbi:MAG: glycosyltransferase family 4 protein [Candidatus Sumerlaeia bacterium]